MKKVLLAFSLMVTISLQALFAQTASITGTVTDAGDRSPIPGVSVFIKGTTVGTVTQPNGTYNLTIPNDATTIVFSFVGMISQEIDINGQSTINASMKNDAINVDEVIVVAYGTSTKGSFTGSAVVIDSKAIEKRQVSNITSALSGSVAGVQVLNDNGQPGETSKVRIRGVGSINAESEPLYVVDGIPFDGDLSAISQSDIENMTVLKDAASTALYGSRGANGIIMITTKKGKKGKSTINFDMKIGVNSRAVKNYDVFSSSQKYMETTYEALYNSSFYNLENSTPESSHNYANDRIHGNSSGGVGYQIYTLPDGEGLIGTDGKLNPNATLGYNDGDYYYTPDNWEDEIFKENLRKEYNLSMTGGNEKTTYYLSLGMLDDEGIIDGSGFKRISGRLSVDHEITKWLKVGANVNINNIVSNYPDEQDRDGTNSSGSAFGIANFIAPVYPLYVRDADTEAIILNKGRKTYDYGDGESTNFDRSYMSIANPAGDLAYNKRDYEKDVANSTWFAELSPMQGLKFSARYGYNVDNARLNSLGNAYMGQSAASGGTVYQELIRETGFTQTYIGNYQFTLDEIHQFDVIVGYEGYKFEYDEIFSQGTNLYNPELPYTGNAIDQLLGGGRKDAYATEGLFTRINYSLNDTYHFNVAYRHDGSSRFSEENRWGDFYSASAAWLISNESFMNSIHWLNMLKLKASYGEQGNDALGNYYAWQDQWEVTGADGVFSDGTLYYKGNKDITWETSISYNIGIDYSVLNNKLRGTIEYFGRESSDMLYYLPVSGITGFNQKPMNIGSMTNSGLEIDLSYTVLKNDNFEWMFNANATFIKNEINELHPNLDGTLIDGSRIYEEGESMYRLNLVEYAGVDTETGKALYWSKNEAGERIETDDYVDALNHKVATDDLMPTVYGGFGTSINAYGFDASIQCSYQLGGEIYDSGYRRLMHGGTTYSSGTNWHNDISGAWKEVDDVTDIPRLNSSDLYANSTSTRWLTSSDYLSINNITIGYTLSSNLASKLKLNKFRVYVSAENVALFAKRKGLDPRQSYTSATTALYSPIRTISGGLNLTF